MFITSVLTFIARSHNNSSQAKEMEAASSDLSSMNLESNNLPPSLAGGRANVRSADSGYMSDTGYISRNNRSAGSSLASQRPKDKICVSCGKGGKRVSILIFSMMLYLGQRVRVNIDLLITFQAADILVLSARFPTVHSNVKVPTGQNINLSALPEMLRGIFQFYCTHKLL